MTLQKLSFVSNRIICRGRPRSTFLPFSRVFICNYLYYYNYFINSEILHHMIICQVFVSAMSENVVTIVISLELVCYFIFCKAHMSKYTNSIGLTKYVIIFCGIRTFVLGICICIRICICISNKAISKNVLKLGFITMAHCVVLHPTFWPVILSNFTH